MATISKRSKSRGRYPVSLKRKIAKSYLAGEASYAVLAEENGLRDKNVVKEFVKWYRRNLSSEPYIEMGKDTSQEEPAESASSLQTQIKELKRQLKRAELKTEMLETMIDIAEEEFQLDIRKKSGTNQSNK
jgi:transposase-like protein